MDWREETIAVLAVILIVLLVVAPMLARGRKQPEKFTPTKTPAPTKPSAPKPESDIIPMNYYGRPPYYCDGKPQYLTISGTSGDLPASEADDGEVMLPVRTAADLLDPARGGIENVVSVRTEGTGAGLWGHTIGPPNNELCSNGGRIPFKYRFGGPLGYNYSSNY